MPAFASLPRPRELPLIGSLHRRFGRAAGNSLDFFTELGRLGPVCRFHLLNESFVLINEPDLVQELLVTQHRHFHKGRALERARHYLGNSLLVSEEEEHSRQRKLLQPAFHRARIAGYAEIMARDASQWADQLQHGQQIDLAKEMNRLALGIVADTLFGSTVEGEAQAIAQALTVIIDNFNRMIMPFYQFLRHVPTRRNRELKDAQNFLEQTIYRLIAERRAESRDRGDLLSMLLAAEDAESEHKRLTDKEVRDQALTLFIAGHETTANGLAWTWHLVAQNPEVRARLLHEVKSLLGRNERPGLDHVAKLPYTRAVFSEAMRLYPPVWIVGRRAQRDIMLGAYEIPKRTIVLCSQYLLHRDPRFWPEPLVFRPERWLEEDPQRPRFAYFPFGAGPRVCIGESFAWTEAVLALATISRAWKFNTVPGTSVEINPTVTLRPKNGIMMTVESSS